jgi:DNA transformation protein
MKKKEPPTLGIGPKSTARLNRVGIFTRAELERLGSVEAFLRVKQVFPNATLNLLYGLEAVLMDIHWTKLPKDVKARLKEEAGIF